jgi:hypothetical protein
MLAFLHTAQAHVATFAALATAVDATLQVRHVVDETLLADARTAGRVTDDVRRRVAARVESLIQEGAIVVVCTCSTIGAAAEAVSVPADVAVMRIDRPMAERAVAEGSRILVVAALASTVASTVALLDESARRRHRTIECLELVCGGAWPYFEQGDLAGYRRAIATAIEAVRDTYDVIVLAQASMAGVAEVLDLPCSVLSSPRTGVESAIQTWRRLKSGSATRYQ